MATTPSNGFLSGVSDLFGSVMQAAPNILNAVNAPKIAAAQATANAQAAAQAALDAYGRRPGDPGYGTTTAPGGIQSTGMPTWLKPVLYVGGGLLVLLVVLKVVKK